MEKVSIVLLIMAIVAALLKVIVLFLENMKNDKVKEVREEPDQEEPAEAEEELQYDELLPEIKMNVTPEQFKEYMHEFKSSQNSKGIDDLKFNVEYEGPLLASIDWVAGGNFDGYVYQSFLRFQEDSTVIIATRIIDQSRYDGKMNDSEIRGTFSEGDKRTIDCVFEKFEMRGKILGLKNDLIAFAILNPKTRDHSTECYKLREEAFR